MISAAAFCVQASDIGVCATGDDAWGAGTGAGVTDPVASEASVTGGIGGESRTAGGEPVQAANTAVSSIAKSLTLAINRT